MEAVAGLQRVQTLAEAGIAHLPHQYVQPPELRPRPHQRPHVTETSIPVVDLAPFGGDPLHAIGRACREWGAFQVINHGVLPRLLEDVKAVGSSFFSSPLEAKLRFACDPQSPASEGYGSRMLSKEEGVLDWRDYFDHHTLPESRRNSSRWPDLPANYRDIVIEYSNNMKKLAETLLCMISQSLDLPPSYIQDAVGEVYQNITFSYYPPCPQPELALGLQSHSDMGAITLLMQDDVGGLEVLKDGQWIEVKPLSDAIVVILADQTEESGQWIEVKPLSDAIVVILADQTEESGQWIEVKPLSDAIVVILADQTEVITNGKYKSAVHRAIVNNQRPRFSVATFYDPSKTKKISPAPQLVSNKSPLKFREVLYGDYVSSWYSKGPEGKRNIDALLIE